MSDAERLTDVLKSMNRWAKVFSAAYTLAVTELVTRTPVDLIGILFLEYFVILWWYWKKQKWSYPGAMRGIACILGMLLTELAIIVLCYCNGMQKQNRVIWGVKNEVQIACYLGMAMMEYCMIVFREILRLRYGFRKMLMVTVGVKAVQDIIWLCICIGFSVFKKNVTVVSALFLLAILINYTVFLILTLRVAEKSEQKERAEIRSNAYEYYLNMEEEHLMIRRMYHDMKNQLMIMEHERAEAQDADPKIDFGMAGRIEQIDRFYHTGKASLDMLLFDGKIRARERNIEFEAVVSKGCLNFMADEDVNIIFSNAIVNAIEACEKITDGERRITIKAGKNLNDTLIYVKNTVNPGSEKGALRSRKKNRIHGIGMASIQESVEKYGGYISITEEDATFQLAILFGKE